MFLLYTYILPGQPNGILPSHKRAPHLVNNSNVFTNHVHESQMEEKVQYCWKNNCGKYFEIFQ